MNLLGKLVSLGCAADFFTPLISLADPGSVTIEVTDDTLNAVLGTLRDAGIKCSAPTDNSQRHTTLLDIPADKEAEARRILKKHGFQ